MNYLSYPHSREEQLEWLRRVKGELYAASVVNCSDEELYKCFRRAYSEFLMLEDAADEMQL